MADAKCVILSGASSGIGAALTRALAEDGYRLFVCARRADLLEEVTDKGRLATAFSCDVTQEADVERFIDQVTSKTRRVYALINCAGVYGAIGPALKVDSAEWMSATQVNLFGVYLMTKHAARLMHAEDEPRIVNFAGGGAFDPLPNCSSYAVSKAACVRLTETLAVELAEQNIRVNAIAPGFIATDMHKATLTAGRDLAGDALYEITKAKLEDGSVPMSVPIDIVRFLLSSAAGRLSGRTLAASFDPWRTPVFADSIDAINESPLYTMQRINLVHLPADHPLRTTLQAVAQKGSGQALSTLLSKSPRPKQG
jgi:NAD(P)-dependent dehydrogenase (short-subunit alcohol dehydrogenase family)